jgi:hypothetical protein
VVLSFAETKRQPKLIAIGTVILVSLSLFRRAFGSGLFSGLISLLRSHLSLGHLLSSDQRPALQQQYQQQYAMIKVTKIAKNYKNNE